MRGRGKDGQGEGGGGGGGGKGKGGERREERDILVRESLAAEPALNFNTSSFNAFKSWFLQNNRRDTDNKSKQ